MGFVKETRDREYRAVAANVNFLSKVSTINSSMLIGRATFASMRLSQRNIRPRIDKKYRAKPLYLAKTNFSFSAKIVELISNGPTIIYIFGVPLAGI